MKKRHTLKCEERTLLGHQAKKVRAEGLLPVTIYGHGFKNVSASVKYEDFLTIYREVGETGLIDLLLNEKSLPILIHVVQKHPVTQELLNAELFKVNLKEKIKANIPITIVGTAPAVEHHLGNLMTLLQEIEVEALPENLPEILEIDVSGLEEVDNEIKVEQLLFNENVTVLTPPEEAVVRIGSLVVEKEPEPEAQKEDSLEEAEEEISTEESPASTEEKSE